MAHNIHSLMEGLLSGLAEAQPEEPLYFLTDRLEGYADRSPPTVEYTSMNATVQQEGTILLTTEDFKLQASYNVAVADVVACPMHYLLLALVAADAHMAYTLAKRRGIEWGLVEFAASMKKFPFPESTGSSVGCTVDATVHTCANQASIDEIVEELDGVSYMRNLFSNCDLRVKGKWSKKLA